MKGSTFKRTLPSGKVVWCLSLDIGRGGDGQRQRVFRSGFRRQGDADVELAKLLQEHREGGLFRPDPRSFSEFMEQWLKEYAERKCAPKTVERYWELSRHATGALGSVPLSKITTLQLQRVYNGLLDARKKDGSPLSVKTVRHVHGLLHVALETAIKWGFLKTNPSDNCDLPPVAQKEAKVLDYAGVIELLKSSSEHWLAELLILDVGSGARRGELLALTWPDIDFSTGMMTIGKSLEQTKKGLRIKETKGRRIRRVKLPNDALEALQRVTERQQEAKRLFGADYRADLNLVFCHPDGSFIRPDTVTKAARRLAKKAGFAGVSLHTLRHSHGSQLLSAGVPLPTVSKRLGHSNVHVTAAIYSHALPADEIAAAEIWQGAMDKVVQKQLPQKRPARVVRMQSKTEPA